MKENNYDSLEEQIGSMGGEVEQEAPTSLGKLKKLNKTDLPAEDKKSMTDFIQKTNRKHEAELEGPKISEGWIPVDRSELGKREIFYPQDWEFAIRPATIQAVKNWTAVDEENVADLNKVFNEIIRLCVKITDGQGNVHTWQEINSWDRFWFILKVREYTFAKGESKIEYTDRCENCDEDIKFTLNSSSLTYEFPDDDIIEKYWDGTKWYIDPKEYGVENAAPVTLWTPKLGKDQAIIDWAIAKARQGQRDIDENFIRFLVWMISKPSRDPQNFESQIRQAQNTYKNWDIDMYSFMNDVINNININPNEKLSTKCPHCGAEVTSNVQFPNGVKTLFQVETKVRKFGSR